MMTETEVDQLASQVVEEDDEMLILAVAVADLQSRVNYLEEKLAGTVNIPSGIRAALKEVAQ